MIRVARGAEPAALRAARARRLSLAVLAWQKNGGTLPKDYPFTGYEVAKEPLYWAQHQKCAYCETKGRVAYFPIEHLRPKDGAARDLGARSMDDPWRWDPEAYWWLAWTWENLFYACPTCNGFKANRFLLYSPPLATLSFELSREDTAIVDPCRDEPLLHLQWRPSDETVSLPRAAWEWLPVAVGAKGGATISALGLWESDISVLVTNDLWRNVLSKVETVEKKVQGADLSGAASLWASLIQETLYEGAPYAAARWCALTYLQSERGSLLAPLPAPLRPGRHGPPTIPEGLPPAPSGIPEAAWLRLLAGEELDDAVVMILSVQPLTPATLLLCVTAAPSRWTGDLGALRAQLKRLVDAGRLIERPGGVFAPP